MGLRALSLVATEITITAPDGRSITLTKVQIQAFFQTTTGNAASRRAQTITWALGQVGAALGDQIDPENLMIEIDGAQNLTHLRYGGLVG